MSDILKSIRGLELGLDKDGLITGANGFNSPLTAASTSSNIPLGGTATLGSTDAAAYTLAAPTAGAIKRLVCTAATTTIQTVTLASGNFLSTTGSSATRASFDGIGEALELVGLSTALWGVQSNTGTVSLTTV